MKAKKVAKNSDIDFPKSTGSGVPYADWEDVRQQLCNALSNCFVLYDSPNTTPQFDVAVLDDRMNDLEFCVALNMDSSAGRDSKLLSILEAFVKENPRYFVGVTPISSRVAEPEFYIAVFQNETYFWTENDEIIAPVIH